MNKALIALIFLGLLLAGCTEQPKDFGAFDPKTEAPQPVLHKIGLLQPLTGDVAAIGVSVKEAVQMAIDDLNSKNFPSARFELIAEDGKCTGAAAASAGNKLINLDKVKFIVGGGCSGETLAVTPVAEKAGVLMLSPLSSSPKITTAGDFVFRDYPSDEFQGAFGAEYMYNELKARKVAVLYSNSDWGVPIKDRFKARFVELGGTIVAEEAVDDKAQDVRTQLTKIKVAGPDAIYMPQYAGAAAIILKQAREMGLNVPLLNGDAGNDPKIIEVAGSAAEGALATVPFSEPPTEWTKRFEEYSGHEVRLGSAHAYDAMMLLGKAILEQGHDPVKVKNYFYKMPAYQGVSGEIRFDINGDLANAKYSVLVIRNGKFEKVY